MWLAPLLGEAPSSAAQLNNMSLRPQEHATCPFHNGSVEPRSYKSMHPQATRMAQAMDAHTSLGHTRLYSVTRARRPTHPQATDASPQYVPTVGYSRIAQAS